MKIAWLIDEYIYDDDTSLKDTVERLGYECKVLPHDYCFRATVRNSSLTEYFYELFPDEDTQVVFHGSIQSCKLIQKFAPSRYITFFNEQSLHVSSYLCNSNLSPHLLNNNGIFLPLKVLWERKYKNVFIRPDSPKKEFTGQLFDYEKQTLSEFERRNLYTSEDTLTYVDNPASLKTEARILLSSTGVCSASLYVEDGSVKYTNLSSGGFVEYVEYLHSNGVFDDLLLRNDGLLVVDIAELTDGFLRVIEVGSFTTSSLYEANFEVVVNTVNEVVRKLDDD